MSKFNSAPAEYEVDLDSDSDDSGDEGGLAARGTPGAAREPDPVVQSAMESARRFLWDEEELDEPGGIQGMVAASGGRAADLAGVDNSVNLMDEPARRPTAQSTSSGFGIFKPSASGTQFSPRSSSGRMNTIKNRLISLCRNRTFQGAALAVILVAVVVGTTVSLISEPSESDQDRLEAAKAAVLKAGISSANSFDDPNSPQSLALEWISLSGSRVSHALDAVFQTRYILSVIFYSLEGDGWVKESDWLVQDDFCQWQEILCNEDGLVQSIYLRDNNCHGKIPDEIGHLVHLEVLDLSENKISGRIPSSIWRMQSMVDLDLGGNLLTGSLPPEVGAMVDLVAFNLANNKLYGRIPTEIQKLSSIQYLGLNANSFGPDFPDLGTLTTLAYLHMDENSFQGPIPEGLFSLPALKEVRLDKNSLTGPVLPSSFDGMRNLLVFRADHNRFRTPIPTSVGLLESLTEFHSSHNLHTGDIPSQLFGLETLNKIIIGNNKFNGALPASVGNAKNLQVLHIQKSFVDGPLPSQIGNLRQLVNFEINGNKMTGNIPTELGFCTSLEVLNLEENQFDGEIPSQFGNMQQLRILRVFGNELTGSVPDGICQVPGLEFVAADCDTKVTCDCCNKCY